MSFWDIPHLPEAPTAPAPPEELEGLLQRVSSWIHGAEEAPAAPEELEETLKGRQADLARSALDKLRSAQLPTRDEAEALDEIIRSRRPALEVKGGRLEGWARGREVLGAQWNQFRRRVIPQTQSIGRIEYRDAAVGTGFVVGDHIIATNAHVLEHLFPRDDRTLDIAGIRFGLTADNNAQLQRLSEVLAVGDDDLALIRLDPDTSCPEPLQVDTSAANRGEPAAVVGYPFADARVPAFANANFEGNFSFVTVSPGKVIEVHAQRRTVDHDCQTLGGNSGSPLLSLQDNLVVGVHFEGRFLSSNSAVAAQALADLLTSVV